VKPEHFRVELANHLLDVLLQPDVRVPSDGFRIIFTK
jgi:hypothetical protein